MALAEASVRVVLDVSRFERELREKVRQAANGAGRDFDRALKQQMATTARTATREFRDATRTGMLRAGRDAAQGFDVSFRQGISQLSGRVGQRLGQGLRTSVSRAGLDAGRGFAANVAQVLGDRGQYSGIAFVNGLTEAIVDRARTAGNRAATALGQAVTSGARNAGRNTAREFSASFDIGIGSARLSRPIVLALASVATAIVQDLAPATGILAGIPSALAAIATAAGVTVVAFRGLGDAFKAIGDANIDDLHTSMQRLAPAAQAVVREFAAIRPELLGLGRDIQNVFFSQLQGQITRISGALTGELRAGLLDVAEATGVLAREFVELVTSSRNLDNLNALFRGTGSLFDALRPGIESATQGILDFVGAAAPGLRSIGNALSELLTSFGQWASRAAASGDALRWIEEGIQGFRDLGETMGDIAQLAGAIIAAMRPLAFAMDGLFSIMSSLASIFESLPGPVQSLALAFLLISRTGILDTFRNITNSARGMGETIRSQFTQLGTVYQSATTPLRSFADQQRMLTSVVGQTPGPLNNLRAGLSSLAVTAAGTARAVGTGLRSAFSGLVGVLGGGWGIALAAATIGLGLLANSQQQAAQAAARHDAEVAELADTLNRQTGAVTQSTRDLVAKKLAEEGAIDSARRLGISAEDLVSASLGQADALDRVNEALLESVSNQADNEAAFDSATATLKRFGVSAEDITKALFGNEEAWSKLEAAAKKAGVNLNDLRAISLDTSSEAYILAQQTGLLNGQLGEAADSTRDAADAMTPAALAAAAYQDALGILADTTADADAKARALADALNVLAGGTVTAEVAQGRFTELLARLDEQLVESTKGLDGMGAALLTSEGRINTQTQAGAFLINTYQQLQSSLTESVAATLEAGRATGDLNGAYVRIAQDTQAARDQFIQTATQMGLSAEQANQLADAYGLIPAQVLTTVTDQGSALNVQLQVAGVYAQLKNLPVNTPVRVEGLTEDAINKLKEVGVEVRTLPDGSVEVTARTESARNSLADLVNSWSGTVIDFVANIIGGNAMGGIVANAKGGIVGYRNGGHHLRKMPANRAEIVAPNTWRVIGDRAAGDEAYIPITNSSRSRAILTTTARRMGFELVPAGWGRRMQASTQPAITVEDGAIRVNAPFADPELVAKATINELARSVAS